MVEAAGIEPASESTALRLLHVYPAYSVLGSRAAGRQASWNPIPLYLTPRSGETPRSQPAL